jgi:radical SAM protein
MPASAPRPSLAETDFSTTPFIVIWETTQACQLACLHCRASARPGRDSAELSTVEAMRLMDEIRGMGRPLVVLTGGDPLERDDIVRIVEYGTSLGLRVSLTPSGTPRMTEQVLVELRDAGLARLAVSLDGSVPAIHDAFRGVEGSYDWTVRMLDVARSLGLSTQINTTISRHNLHDLDAMIAVLGGLGIALWSVFFIVPTGRARPSDLATPEEHEAVFHRLYDLSRTAPFDIKTTAAPHYRRVVLQRQTAERRLGTRTGAPSPLTAGLGFSLADGIGRAKSVTDGNGFVFVSHRGEIYPSGFLPISSGNVRTHRLADVYRESDIFRALRDPERLRGKCGVCEYRALCGGSRARAYAMSGDYLASDPSCVHVPARFRNQQA